MQRYDDANSPRTERERDGRGSRDRPDPADADRWGGFAGRQAGELGLGQGFGPGAGFGRGYYGGSRFTRRSASGHRGLGPDGYVRRDERICEEVCDRLMESDLDPTGVSVRVEKGEVTLKGTVDDRATKLDIEEIADSVLGVRDVVNQIRVRSREEGS